MARTAIINRKDGQYITFPQDVSFPGHVKWVEIISQQGNLLVIPKRPETRKGYILLRRLQTAELA